MTKNIYVASHCRWAGLWVASVLTRHGLGIHSSWLQEEFRRTDTYSEEERQAIASKNVSEVIESDGLVLVASADRVPGGKFVEAGIALSFSYPVVIIGHRENMLLWHPDIAAVSTPDEAAEWLNKEFSR